MDARTLWSELWTYATPAERYVLLVVAARTFGAELLAQNVDPDDWSTAERPMPKNVPWSTFGTDDADDRWNVLPEDRYGYAGGAF